MNKRYEITVVEHTYEERIEGKTWQIGADPSNVKSGWEGYGYTPEIKKMMPVTRTIYTQNTDSLDLAAVIATINNLIVSL